MLEDPDRWTQLVAEHPVCAELTEVDLSVEDLETLWGEDLSHPMGVHLALLKAMTASILMKRRKSSLNGESRTPMDEREDVDFVHKLTSQIFRRGFGRGYRGPGSFSLTQSDQDPLFLQLVDYCNDPVKTRHLVLLQSMISRRMSTVKNEFKKLAEEIFEKACVSVGSLEELSAEGYARVLHPQEDDRQAFNHFLLRGFSKTMCKGKGKKPKSFKNSEISSLSPIPAVEEGQPFEFYKHFSRFVLAWVSKRSGSFDDTVNHVQLLPWNDLHGLLSHFQQPDGSLILVVGIDWGLVMDP